MASPIQWQSLFGTPLNDCIITKEQNIRREEKDTLFLQSADRQFMLQVKNED